MEKRFRNTGQLCRIAVTGPESTGKSMLAASLAACFNTVWVTEFARTYLAQLGRPYQFEDIVEIAKGQLASENARAQQASGLLICDTELIVTKVWSEFKYNKCDSWITDQIDKHRYDLYLLCDIDLPWELDPLREHPDRRKDLFDLYQAELETRGFPYGIVRGSGPARLQNALRIISEKTGIKQAVV